MAGRGENNMKQDSKEIDHRVDDLNQGILELEARSEAGFSLSTKQRRGFKKYNNALSHLIPVRKSNRSQYEFPLARAGCLSTVMYSWLTPYLLKIFRKGTDFLENIQILEEDSSKVNADRIERIWMEEYHNRGPAKSSFGRVLFRAVRTRLIVTCVTVLFFCAFSLINPIFLIHSFLQYLSEGEVEIKKGLLYVFGILFCELGRAMTSVGTWSLGYRSGLRVRSGATSFLFRKILRLKNLKDKTVGELVNLVANDGQRLFEATALGPLAICAPVVLLLGSVATIHLMGAYGIIACTIFLGFYPFSALISKLTAKFRREGILVTDKRVQMMTELLTCIKLIKMYAWEKPFAKTIADIRSKERGVLEKGAYVQSLSTSIASMVPVIAAAITFIAYVSTGNDLTAAKAFTLVAILNAMRFSLGVMPYAIKALAESSVSVKRYKSVLCMEEIQELRCGVTNSNQKVAMKDASFSWALVEAKKDNSARNGSVSKPLMNGGALLDESVAFREADETTMLDAVVEPTLVDLTFVLEKGKFLGVCGSVGCGKSSLMSSILGRMDLVSGKVAVNGSVAYVPQQAWITNSTVRENILFGLPYNEARYKEVTAACALVTDFHTFVNGDMTEIGERGINLSGGQKQRISLARAVYSDNEIYLLDDPLSAVDVHVGHHIVQYCLLKLLKGKTVMFVTHQLQYLVHCDEVMFMKDGQIAEMGGHTELMEADGEYASLMKMYYTEHTEEVEEEEEDIEPRVRLSSFTAVDIQKNKTANAVQGESTPVKSSPPPLDRMFSRGAGIGTVSPIPPNDKPPFERLFSREAVMSTPPTLERLFSRGAMIGEDHKVEVYGGGLGVRVERQFSNMSLASSGDEDADGKLIVAEEQDTGAVTCQIYLEYIRDGGGFLVFLGVLMMFFFTVAAQTGATWFLSFWINQGSGNTSILLNNMTVISDSISDHPNKNMFTLTYGMFVVIMFVLTCFRAYTFMKATLKASSGLHDHAFENILHSPMEFFDTTPTGRIINRFSADMDEVDIRLPMQAEVFINNVLLVIFSLLMICYMSPWFLVAIIPLLILFIVLFLLFSRCARSLKRLDSITRSPLVSHVTASVQGITTIHAYGKVDEFYDKFYKLMDTNSVPFFIFCSSSRWLSLRLDLICVAISSITALIIVFSYDHITPAVAGLALSYAVQMAGLFQFTVRLAVETMSRFTSVQRVQEYAKEMKREDHLTLAETLRTPPPDWPAEGRIVYNKLKMRYREGMTLALKAVSFSVQPQEKIGIVGRSGSGKSSLGVALFRLVEAASGSILIDGVDISRLPLWELRSKLAIIPQDPVMFVGTVRYNLDPFSEHADISLWEALEKCHVKDTIAGLDGQLEAPVVENGENFSVGERQLICLARALLRHSKILMLDEATAAIDTETDTLVQITIKEAFADCTMLIIAHRLNTVLTCDRILVMEDGRVVEFDKPSVLMSRSDSKFKAMLEATEGQQEIS